MSGTALDLRTPLLQTEPSTNSAVYRPHSTWTALKVDTEGNTQACHFDKHELTQRYSIPNRDLRTVDPAAPLLAPTTIFVREQALVVVLEALRCIIFKDHVLVLAVPGDSDGTGSMARNCCSIKAMQSSRFVQELVGKLQGRSHISMSVLDATESKAINALDTPRGCMPAGSIESDTHSLFYSDSQLRPSMSATDSVDFEFTVLEVMLTMTIKALENETVALENLSRGSMQQLQHQVSKGALANIITAKTHAVKLNSRVQRYRQELERILQDNEEMAEMFLTRRSLLDGALAGGPVSQRSSLMRVSTIREDGARAAVAAAAVAGNPGLPNSPPKAFLRTSTIRRPLRAPSLMGAGEDARTPSGMMQSSCMPTTTGHRGPQGPQGHRDDSLDDDENVSAFSRAGSGAALRNDAPPKSLLLASDELGQVALVQAIGEVEDMLEYYFMLVASVCSRVNAVRERIASVESSVQIEQDHRRNELVALELMVNTVTMAFGLVAMIAGVFGMNLLSGWETNPIAFVSVTAISAMLGVVICLAVGLYARAKRLLFISGVLGGEPRFAMSS